MIHNNLQIFSQYQSSPRPEVVLCHSSIYEAKPKYMGLYVVGELDLPRYTFFITSGYRTPLLAWPSVRNTSQGLTRTGFLFWIPVRRPTWYEVAAVANAKSNRSPSR